MATVNDIKAALSFAPDPTRPPHLHPEGRNVGATAVARISAWFSAVTQLKDAEGEPRAATADDFAAQLYHYLEERIIPWEKTQAAAALPAPDALTE